MFNLKKKIVGKEMGVWYTDIYKEYIQGEL